jgi:hypothetical protein
MDDGEGCGVGDRQRWIGRGRGQAPAREPGLSFAQGREGRLHRALESLLDDELRLAVAEQYEDGVETAGN